MPAKLMRLIVTKTYVETFTVCGPTEEAIRQAAEDIVFVRNRSGLLDADLRTVPADIQLDVVGDA